MKNNKFTKSVVRIALPLAIGAAALGMAGVASAQTQEPVGPGYQYAPTSTAHPAPQAPTTHHGVGRVEQEVPGYHR
jgi:hypothetical protein